MESMTGFGRGVFIAENFQVLCLAKSLNHRFLEISLKLPKRYMLLEERIRRVVAQNFERGKIEITLKVYGLVRDERDIIFDFTLAEKLKRNLEILKETLKINGEITLSDIINFREIVLFSEREEDVNSLWEEVSQAIEKALQELKESRLREGENLKVLIQGFLNILGEKLNLIESLKERVQRENILKTKERINKLLKELGGSLDEQRFYQEMAILLDKYDFTEELGRLKLHLGEAFRLLQTPSSGKRLEFLCQELNREINTLANKAQSVEISHLAVEIKDLIEKIREQVQNVV